MIDRCKDPNFIDRILNLFLLQFLESNSLQRILDLILQPPDSVHLTISTLAYIYLSLYH